MAKNGHFSNFPNKRHLETVSHAQKSFNGYDFKSGYVTQLRTFFLKISGDFDKICKF